MITHSQLTTPEQLSITSSINSFASPAGLNAQQLQTRSAQFIVIWNTLDLVNDTPTFDQLRQINQALRAIGIANADNRNHVLKTIWELFQQRLLNEAISGRMTQHKQHRQDQNKDGGFGGFNLKKLQED